MTTTNKTFYHEQGSKRTRLSVTRFCWTFIPVEFKRTGIMERPQARRCIFRHFRIKLSNSSLEVLFRSSHPEVFCKKGILRSFTKFTGKHLKPATLLKKSLWHRCFPVNSVKFLRTPFYKEHLWWLLLFIHCLFLRCKNINDFLTSSWSCIVALTYFFTQ